MKINRAPKVEVNKFDETVTIKAKTRESFFDYRALAYNVK